MKRKTLLCIILIVRFAVLAAFSEPVTFSFYDSQRSFDDFIVKIDFDDIDVYMMIDDGDVHYWLFKNKELLVDGLSGAAQFSYATEDCSFGVEDCEQAFNSEYRFFVSVPVSEPVEFTRAFKTELSSLGVTVF
ncbi:MAG: hypothetical protein K5751_01770 [Treponemataceae bacterium]|nr:hypothetical protein [Treponemataceae bacterium]